MVGCGRRIERTIARNSRESSTMTSRWTIAPASQITGRDAWVMATTPRQIVKSVVRSVCGREVGRILRLTSGGVNETYRVELPDAAAVVVRISREPVPRFTDEEHVMAQA